MPVSGGSGAALATAVAVGAFGVAGWWGLSCGGGLSCSVDDLCSSGDCGSLVAGELLGLRTRFVDGPNRPGVLDVVHVVVRIAFCWSDDDVGTGVAAGAADALVGVAAGLKKVPWMG